MTIDEQELTRLLQETADLSDTPRFTAQDLTRRVRRRRARLIRAALGALVVLAALAVLVPTALNSHNQRAGIESRPPPPPPIKTSYAVTVNGRTRQVPFPGTPAHYAVTPGEHLSITLEVTIPARTTVKTTGLWIGISPTGTTGLTPSGPADMTPILVAKPHAKLGPGTYRFTVHWTAPASLLTGTSPLLWADVAWAEGSIGQTIVVFTVPGDSGGDG